MAFFNKLGSIFKDKSKDKVENLEKYDRESGRILKNIYEKEYIRLKIDNLSFCEEDIKGLINLYNLNIDDNDILIPYEEIYNFYYDEYDNEVLHYEGYVPDFMAIEEEGYGDYIDMIIDENGCIQKWNITSSDIQPLMEDY